MKNINGDCTHDSKNKHVVRQRGNKVRKQCGVCCKIGKWERLPQSTPNPTIPTKVNIPAPRNAEQATVMDAVDWNNFTVADLRQQAKERGLTGYSKMKRDDLIDMLGAKA